MIFEFLVAIFGLRLYLDGVHSDQLICAVLCCGTSMLRVYISLKLLIIMLKIIMKLGHHKGTIVESPIFEGIIACKKKSPFDGIHFR